MLKVKADVMERFNNHEFDVLLCTTIIETGIDIPYFQGCDPGVSFISEYNPNNNTISVMVSNYRDNVWKEMRKIREHLYK